MRTKIVGEPASSVGPLSAAQKLVKNDYLGGPAFAQIIHLRAMAVRVVVMM